MQDLQELLKNQPLMELFLNNLPCPLAILDKDFNFIMVNDTYARETNRFVIDFPGHNFFDFYPDAKAEAIFRNVVQTKKPYHASACPWMDPQQPEKGMAYWNWTLAPVLDQDKEVLILILSLANVTEQKQKEMALETAQCKTNSFLDQISDAFYTLDKKWCFTYINKVAEHCLGKKAAALFGKNIWREYPHLINSKIYTYYHEAMYTKTPLHFENRSIYCGKNHWYAFNVYPSPDGISVYAINITNCKKIENTLKQNQKRLEALLKINKMSDATMPEIMAFTLEEMLELTGSKAGWIASVSPDEAWIQLLAWSKREMKQCQIKEKPLSFSVASGGLWTQSILQRKAMIINDYSAQRWGKRGLPQGHIPLQRILILPVWDQERIVMLAALANKHQRYNNGDVHQLSLLLKEIWNLIQRKKAEEKQRENEEKFRCFFNHSADGMLIFNPHGTIVSANPAICQMLGMNPAKLGSIADLADPQFDLLIKKVEQTGLGQGNFNFIHNNGSKIPVEVTLKKYQVDSGQEFTGAIIRNQTEKIKTQQQLLQLERLNLIGQLAAGIGHEVRNPLTVVRGFIQLLSGKEKYNNDKAYFDLILNELDRANAIITDFLSVARVKPTSMKLENLNDIIHNLYPLIHSDALNMDKNLTFIPQSLPDILMNKKEIHQLILNLVRNGLEATPPRGEVQISTFMEKGDIVLAIKDEGPGIDREILNQLGTPFLTTKEQGTGLGLTTSFGIAKRHQAEIEVDTGPEGTTFIVRFKIDNKI